MAATNETIWETRPEHNHRHRRTSISSAAGVYPGVHPSMPGVIKRATVPRCLKHKHEGYRHGLDA